MYDGHGLVLESQDQAIRWTEVNRILALALARQRMKPQRLKRAKRLRVIGVPRSRTRKLRAGRRKGPQRARAAQEVRELSRAEMSIGREMDHIMGCAARDEVHVVGLDELIFFSAPGGQAWILDAEDDLAYCLMDDYERQPGSPRLPDP